MAGKKDGIPVSFRIEPELAALLDRFTDLDPSWSKTEAVVVGLHLLLHLSDDEREKALLGYRRWVKQVSGETGDGKPGSGRLRPPGKK